MQVLDEKMKSIITIMAMEFEIAEMAKEMVEIKKQDEKNRTEPKSFIQEVFIEAFEFKMKSLKERTKFFKSLVERIKENIGFADESEVKSNENLN